VSSNLMIPVFRRVIGAGFVFLFFVIGTIGLLYGNGSEALSNGSLSLVESSYFLIVCGFICTPFLLYPCLFDRFPDWVESFPKQTVDNLKLMLGSK
jgi:hypothetical protein